MRTWSKDVPLYGGDATVEVELLPGEGVAIAHVWLEGQRREDKSVPRIDIISLISQAQQDYWCREIADDIQENIDERGQ